MKHVIYAILSNYSINHNSSFIEQGNQRLLVFLFTEKDYKNNRGTPSLTSSNNTFFFFFFFSGKCSDSRLMSPIFLNICSHYPKISFTVCVRK